MRISKRTDYALRVLFALVERWGDGPVSMAVLARSNDVPKRFLEHIMLDLKKQGWVKSSPGRKGGYELARDPREISMGQIVRYFDGILPPIGHDSVSHHEPGDQSPTRRFRRLLLEIRKMTAAYMDNSSLAQVFANDPREVFSLEFTSGDGI